MSLSPVIVWFRRDLRLGDNPAFHYAVESGQPVIALYIDEIDRTRPHGGASKWWLHYSLKSLSNDLSAKGVKLIIRRGVAQEILSQLCRQTAASLIVWNRRYEEDGRQRDGAIKSGFSQSGIDVKSFNGALLTEPWRIKPASSDYYKVFTPYWKKIRSDLNVAPPIEVPQDIKGYSGALNSLSIDELDLLPSRPDWAAKLQPLWQIGEAGAHDALSAFIENGLSDYAMGRNRADLKNSTSKLSPHLAFGEISPRQIWAACTQYDPKIFLSEIGWREFSYVLLFHNPQLAHKAFKAQFNSFPYAKDDKGFHAWCYGQTGYPYIDAGMRQLWQTGWMHNRVRMATASFLIKHLLIDWREGEKWFHDTLVDFDPASNAASWQWVAGSGADASPYFRIFNPITQGKKFDPNGDYVKRFVPELRLLPIKYIHEPWEASESILKSSSVTLGKTYPKPIVDHKFARERALDALKQIKS